ncbi:MAG: hypothetical protein HKN33_08510 [Pyrinomonadaceae bacterium]|nr:hypothetical protein [Pyrinomonadaceae bacterium]
MRFWKSNIFSLGILVIVLLGGCTFRDEVADRVPVPPGDAEETSEITRVENPKPVIHVLVALCDNESQGIVPVPAHLGNGDDPDGNLYWGAKYGVEAFFFNSSRWDRLPDPGIPAEGILRRLAFRHKKTGAYLIADAYRGRRIKAATIDFLNSAAGNEIREIELDGRKMQTGGGSDVIVYIGHNGLMDFKVDTPAVPVEGGTRDAVVLACLSRKYFRQHLKDTGAKPLLLTSNLMAPEAYILHDALEARLSGESEKETQLRAAAAYAKYQQIGQKAAEGLIVTGW